MQNCNHQIARDYWSIFIVILLTPLLLYATLSILPTHDDWAGTSTPDFSPFLTKEHFLFYGYHWRPFDTWIGYIVGRNPQLLYPTFNHILVVFGHLCASLALFKLLAVLGFNKTIKNVATLLFFILPATMATVTAIDSQNQVYALLTDMIAFLFYIKNNKYKYILWPFLIFLATLFKENGLMWALICPILAFGFDIIDKKTLKKDLFVGLGIMIVYALAILIQPKNIIIHPDYEPGLLKVIHNLIKCLFSSFITVDYIYLLHQPNRNLLLALASFLLSLPFFYYLLIRQCKLFIHKKIVCVILCFLIAIGPHLLTIFSMMHTYAGLPFVILIIAYALDIYKGNTKPVFISLILLLITAIAIDIHLINASIKSGQIGKKMAQEAIKKTGKPADKVYLIIIEDNYPRLSSFCAIPNEAFGWGLSTKYETNYQWPKSIKDTVITRNTDAIDSARKIGKGKIKSKLYDVVWIADKDKIDVIR